MQKTKPMKRELKLEELKTVSGGFPCELLEGADIHCREHQD